VLPIVVVGNKSDLGHKREVTEQQGRDLAKDLGATYTESSAKDNKGVDDIFQMMIHKIDKPDEKCTIL
jgi:GTPase SAR1 family protein